MKLATCTVMTYAGPKFSRYAVMQGPMGRKAFLSRKAKIIAAYTVSENEFADYKAMTAAHATPDAPAVYWQA